MEAYTEETPVYAIEGGEVTFISPEDTTPMNMQIRVQHISENGPFLAIYGHVYPKTNLQVGERVSKGEKIGTLRLAGDVMHLHFELNTNRDNQSSFGRVRDGTVNPMQYLIDNPPAEIVATGTTDSSGLYEISVPVPPAGKWYLAVISVLDYILTNYLNIAIEPNITTYLETVFQINTTYSG